MSSGESWGDPLYAEVTEARRVSVFISLGVQESVEETEEDDVETPEGLSATIRRLCLGDDVHSLEAMRFHPPWAPVPL